MDIVLRYQPESRSAPSKMYAVITGWELDRKEAAIQLYCEEEDAHVTGQSYSEDAYVVEINFLTKYVG